MEENEYSLHRRVRSFGVTGACSGYRYLVCALELLREEPDRLELVTKRLYPEVARRFGVTAGTVEGALRRAAARYGPRREDARPATVREFLALLAGRDGGADDFPYFLSNPPAGQEET